MNESRRLGEENISTLLRQFSIPCIMGLLIGAFYNIVDQTIGKEKCADIICKYAETVEK